MKPMFVLVTTLALVPTQSAWTGGDARPPQNPSPHNPRSPQNLRRSTAQACPERSRRGCPARSAAFREGHGFSHAESYPCSPDPTAHVGADALVRPVRQCRRERPARAVASKGLGSAESILESVILNERRFCASEGPGRAARNRGTRLQ